MKRILLIDGDVLVYKIACASEQIIDWGDGMTTLHSRADEAGSAMDIQIAAITALLEGDQVIVALTCHDTVNFRKAFFPPYKENRVQKRKPLCWKSLRQHLLDAHGAMIKPNLEADDVLGILSTMPHPGDERIIVSVDKDFKTIPGLFYNLKDGKGPVKTITEDEADYNFMLQTLMGDSADNYPGCPGIGSKRADLILSNAVKGVELHEQDHAMWVAVLKTFKAAGFGPEYALTQARCARILRHEDYNVSTRQPILWRAPDEHSVTDRPT